VKRVLVASAILALAALGPAALGQSLDGGCTVSATSNLDSTTMLDATRSDPFNIDPDGRIAWIARSPAAIMNHEWVINVEVGSFGVPVARGGDPNEDGTVESVGDRSIPELVAQAEASGVPGAGVLGELRGIYRVFGDISGSSSCAGDAYVNIEGNPLEALVGQIALGLAALGLILMLLSGIAKETSTVN
jgi:hypothetical protein